MEDHSEEAWRRRAIIWVTSLTNNTPFEPQPHEQLLLERYARGELALNEMEALLEQQVHHVLYCSEAVRPFGDNQLSDLLEKSQYYNEQHQITGLLCYSGGHVVQLLEGPKQAVYTLYAKIRQDPRHHHVLALSDGGCPQRWFADWRMALVELEPPEMYWILTYLETRRYKLVTPRQPITNAHLLTLLEAFSQLPEYSCR